MKRVCVFCGSHSGTKPIYGEAARKLGELLVTRKIGLVFGGGHVGLMGILADAVLAGGGEVIGVIPQALVDRELAHSGCTHLHIVETMHQRKALMADLAEGFIALPGGIGTGEELFEILTWAQLQLHNKPIGILNVEGYFNGLFTWLSHMRQENFLQDKSFQLLLKSPEPEQLLDLIATATRNTKNPQ